MRMHRYTYIYINTKAFVIERKQALWGLPHQQVTDQANITIATGPIYLTAPHLSWAKS